MKYFIGILLRETTIVELLQHKEGKKTQLVLVFSACPGRVASGRDQREMWSPLLRWQLSPSKREYSVCLLVVDPHIEIYNVAS